MQSVGVSLGCNEKPQNRRLARVKHRDRMIDPNQATSRVVKGVQSVADGEGREGQYIPRDWEY